MAEIRINNLSFRYPQSDTFALKDVSLEIEKGSFNVLCGRSGCGKSTLLRHLKKNMMPYGEINGKVLYREEPVHEMDDRRSAAEIGFVQQNPDNQLVTDKVWHELAFGLESLGFDNQVIKRRVAEMASYFGIQGWFRANVAELSGGQKQLLNLASIMAMQPEVLVLDEPTSQLDPIAAEDFLKTVYRINRDLGVTVILSEHRLETLFTMADNVIVMDGGRIIASDEPRKIGAYLIAENHPMFYGLPSVMKIYSHCFREGRSPLTVREGRLCLEENLPKEILTPSKGREDLTPPHHSLSRKSSSAHGDSVLKNKDNTGDDLLKETPVLTLDNLYFRYSRESGDVLRGLSLEVYRGELFALLGGNGTGKSTTLKCITGINKVQRGKITTNGKIGMLPQNPQALFTEITVEEELLEALYYEKVSDDERISRVEEMLSMMEIEHLRKSHPYDLSGGEQQRLALGKILLLNPDILLLDEPTKGLDPFFKITLAGVFDRLKERGITIFMVSHDIEFCAQYADRCGMFFDGEITSLGDTKEFFAGNSFYTTTANRMAGKWYPEGITWEEVASWAEEAMKGKR